MKTELLEKQYDKTIQEQLRIALQSFADNIMPELWGKNWRQILTEKIRENKEPVA